MKKLNYYKLINIIKKDIFEIYKYCIINNCYDINEFILTKNYSYNKNSDICHNNFDSLIDLIVGDEILLTSFYLKNKYIKTIYWSPSNNDEIKSTDKRFDELKFNNFIKYFNRNKYKIDKIMNLL